MRDTKSGETPDIKSHQLAEPDMHALLSITDWVLFRSHSSRDHDLVRKARESHLIDKAMTLEPHGLNRRDELL